MNTGPVTSDLLRGSVIAVPPMARHEDLSLAVEENRKIVRHVESGGITSFLYGGNAIFYHIRPSEYGAILDMLEEIAGPDTFMIPSVGPAWGLSMDQAEILKERDFPTAMALPQLDVTTPSGIQTGLRKFAESYGKPIVVYLKDERYLSPSAVKELVDDGIVSFIKYAVVRTDATNDPYLQELTGLVNPDLMVSGIGELPAIPHLKQFGLVSMTSGSCSVAPALSAQMLRAIQAERYGLAEELRGIFLKLEDLRNSLNPIRVLHDAVSFAGIADTGPVIPLLSEVEDEWRSRLREAAQTLYGENGSDGEDN